MLKKLVAAAVLVLGTAPVFAAPEHLDIINQQCGIQLGQPPAVCNCISQNAGTELNDTQQAFMAAQVTANGAEVARAQTLMTADQAVGVMQFMSTIIAQCGG